MPKIEGGRGAHPIEDRAAYDRASTILITARERQFS